MSKRGLIGAAFLALLLAAPASAIPTFPGLMTVEQVGAGTMTVDSDLLLCATSVANANLHTCDGSGQTLTPPDPAFEWLLTNWSITLDQDPSVSSAFGFTNTSATTQTFVITVSIPVTVFGPASTIGGSTGGSTTDASGDGLGGIATVSPDPLYAGLVDGATALSIYPDPTSFSFVFGGQTVTIPALNPGLPGATLPGPALTATIGIRNKFTLSAGDSVAMTNFFQVLPVPEPGTGTLLMLGLASLAALRRR